MLFVNGSQVALWCGGVDDLERCERLATRLVGAFLALWWGAHLHTYKKAVWSVEEYQEISSSGGTLSHL